MKFSLKHGHKLNALVVDDEDDIRETLMAFLEMLEIFTFIVEAKDGAEAIMKLKNQRFDLVVTDLSMPKIKGSELIEIINKEDIVHKRKTPVILFSANLTGEEVKHAIQCGVKHILAKPCTANQFLEKVEEVLKKELTSKVNILE